MVALFRPALIMPAVLRRTLVFVLMLATMAFLPVGIAALIFSTVLCVGKPGSQKQCQYGRGQDNP